MPDVGDTKQTKHGSESPHTANPAVKSDALSERNTTESPLLRLPAEIRNRVYEYALSDRFLIHPAFQDPAAMAYEPDNSMHNLPLACRQLYRETHLLVYKYGIFEIRQPDWFTDFIRNRADVQSAITQIKIQEELIGFFSSFQEPSTSGWHVLWADLMYGEHRKSNATLRGLSNLKKVIIVIQCCPEREQGLFQKPEDWIAQILQDRKSEIDLRDKSLVECIVLVATGRHGIEIVYE
ncbi:hypothetical protein P171DRAFT_445856 [Karstenula rhodostoma CBS 690.94]|uniref:Uncharacterized protein n=1 Tax=Karstenula rhodostoma CBS 690.94 TaxID=1392251 RepID=A0A9P4U9E4_9PLEO|nr:hypothetical protein P171DRAFT_445856 [Karstenula rhodostoma CBS 690.94]